MTSVFDHLETYAGEILQGWSRDENGDKLPFQVVQLSGGPHAGTATFATLGLSNFALASGKVGDDLRYIRHELVMVVPSDAIPGNIGGILLQAGTEAIARNLAYLRGDVIGPKGALFEGYEPKALYASVPVYFPDGFASVQAEGVGDVAIAWLIPLLDDEVAYVHSHGWSQFEDRLVEQDPDLVDYRRSCIDVCKPV